MIQRDFDHVVVGNGLLGAATALELVRMRRRVCLVGARHGAEGRWFAGHHDDSRMLRLHHADAYWEDLTRLNLQRMHETPPGPTSAYFTPTPVRFRGFPRSDAAPALQPRRSAGNALLDDFDAEDESGGIVDPLQYIAAMNAQSEGWGLVRHTGVVHAVHQLADGCEVETDRGRYTAHTVLHASGFHAAADIDTLRIAAKVVLFASRPEADRGPTECFVDASPGAPAFSDVYGFCDYRTGADGIVSKFGFSEAAPILLEPGQVAEWFTGGYMQHPLLAEMRSWVRSWNAGFSKACDVKPCAFTITPNRRPGLWKTGSQVWLAGCNGMAAKCCQALARSAVAALEPEAWPDFPAASRLPVTCHA